MLGWLFKKRKRAQWTINVHAEAQTNEQTAAAWAVYSGTKALVRMGQYFDLHPERRGQDSPFDEEWFARDALAELWATNSPTFQNSDPYLSLLVQLRDAELLREYVWTFLRDVGWSEPGGLRLTLFDKWWSEHGEKDHVPNTFSSIVPAS